MKDQAYKLREMINNLKMMQLEQQTETENYENKNSRVITVTSGKGGVGKTNFSVNLAIALRELGYKVIVIDADLGLANVDVVLGLIPRYTLVDALNSEKNILEIICEGPSGIKFISGGSGIEDLIKLSGEKLDKFINNISQLDRYFDIIIFDTGAGLSDSIVRFVMAADEVIVVTTPEPTSITDAYALIKTIAKRGKKDKIKIVVNKAESVKEGDEVLSKIMLATEKFLDIKPEPLGVLLYDELVVKAVKMQQPFYLSFPNSQASRMMKQITRKLVNIDNKDDGYRDRGIKGFIKRLAGIAGVSQ